jgi:excisionase family DNA binding protein
MSGSTTPTAGASPFMTCAEVALLLRVKPGQVADYCRNGALPAYRPSRAWLIRREDVDAFLAESSNQPAAS